MLQRIASLRRLAIELDASEVESIFHAHDYRLELAPLVLVRRRAIISGKVLVQLRED